MAIAMSVAGAVFAVASLAALSAEQRNDLADRLRRAAGGLAGRVLRFCATRRTRAAAGWGLAVFAPAVVACLTLSLWWIQRRVPMPAVIDASLDALTAHHLLLCPVVAALGGLLIPGSVRLRVGVGACAGVAALFAYDVAVRTLDVLFGMSVVPA